MIPEKYLIKTGDSSHNLFLSTLDKDQVENIQKWIIALKFGNFRQGVQSLHNGNRHCCLGVADKVCKLNEKALDTLLNEKEKIGLRDDEGGFYIDTYRLESLTEFNDSGRYNFKEIGNFIEKRYEVEQGKSLFSKFTFFDKIKLRVLGLFWR